MENQASLRRFTSNPSQSLSNAPAPSEPRAADQCESFGFIAASDLPVLPINWLVTDYLEQNTLAVLYGRPDKDKTLFALDLSCCVATNTPLYGQAVRQGAVFYISGEGHQGITRCLNSWSRHNDVSLQDAPLFISSHPTFLAQLSITAHITALGMGISALSNATGHAPALIVIDTLSRNFIEDENSVADIDHFLCLVEKHLRSCVKATVLVIHHSGKYNVRRSPALKSAIDAELKLSRSADDRFITLSARMKNALEPVPKTLDLVEFLRQS